MGTAKLKTCQFCRTMENIRKISVDNYICAGKKCKEKWEENARKNNFVITELDKVSYKK